MGLIDAQRAAGLILDLKRTKRKRETSLSGVNPRAHQEPIGLNIASDRPIWLQIARRTKKKKKIPVRK